MESTAQQPAHPVLQRLGKSATAILMLGLLCAALWFLFATPAGAHLRADPRGFGNSVRSFILAHPLAAPLALLSLYTLFAVLALPIWWLQILAGVGLGLYEGTLVCLIGSTLGAAIAFALSRWIAADFFHQRIESKMQQLKQLDQTLGHNGLLFVMTIRLIPLLPFGLFNYAFGLTNVSFLDAVLGTFLGALPIVAVHVGVGAGYYPWNNWKYDLALTCITLTLMLPLILRYLRPHWFKKIGVE
jgi:uncharacterized membrane protein YdjX (TVP38/TMEM64 family)